MHKGFILAALAAVVVGGSIMLTAAEPAKSEKTGGKLLRHVVLFKFKEGTTGEQLDKITSAFAALREKIDTIQDFEWGTDVGVENLANGFTHCFLVTFRDAAGRDAYLPHKAHQEFVTLVKPSLDKVLVVDYWTKR